MRLFGPIYDRCLVWAAHHRAPHYLAALSLAESVFFPVPPDVMLAPMALSTPQRWMRLAAICTIASVVGGVLGYLLGHFALEAIWPWMLKLGWDAPFFRVQGLFERYGFWIVFVAAFTPIPYKVFTIASGATGIGLVPFLLGSTIGRGVRFFLVAGLIAFGGKRLEQTLRRYIEILGWAVAVLVVGAVVWLELRG
ncbi:YqaA family protein [Marilutibacter maris]|uniref:DedA family protein n=1 Tax=Marilutibacter maris TaxID=1605891 RepID=A0A2U9T5M8_9GAMM|nr:YqaA family protein [Lysobacter maris]AWV07833.1 membrane protein [Lysobacter maris]KAB8190179.1 DedA family protein [Lysobacter maris]